MTLWFRESTRQFVLDDGPRRTDFSDLLVYKSHENERMFAALFFVVSVCFSGKSIDWRVVDYISEVSMDATVPPLTVHGFCAGCQQHDKRLTMVAQHRYRCDECGARERKKTPFQGDQHVAK